jgi:hypothetical protein
MTQIVSRNTTRGGRVDSSPLLTPEWCAKAWANLFTSLTKLLGSPSQIIDSRLGQLAQIPNHENGW